MQFLLDIRKTTGLRQPALADFFGMTKQALAKIEKGVFSLSTDNLLKLSRLQVCLNNAELTAEKKQVDIAAQCDLARRRETTCRDQAEALQRRLSKYEAAFKKATCFSHALSVMEPADEGEALWRQKMKIEIRKKLGKYGPTTCKGLQKQIFLLNAEADYLNQFMSEQQSNH